ncbi:hypothetical protein F3K34_43730 [Streptomyces sp. LBUM 1486]|uniref:hypothetical protein n=1 Tax=Streptomyces scabiei TaxID=1930 RepID=UPI001B32A71D|nr:hypothetical protein [Streptomyces sp. LBUM 1486]MBP5918698.1 hypothetical protein [Streptomyces sp. LBUM 1486]
MARSPRLNPDVIRARLTVAADRLAERGDDDLAEAVRAVMQPRGWELLKPAPASSGNRNLGLWMDKAAKERIERKAKEAGDALADVVNEGYRKFLAGEFVPAPLARAPRGSAPEKENLNVRPDNTLREQVEAAAAAKSEELGHPVSASRVAMAFLFSEYGEEELLLQ